MDILNSVTPMPQRNTGLTEDQVRSARSKPVMFVARQAYLLAGSICFVWLLMSALFTSWDPTLDPREIVFVSMCGGVGGALWMLRSARRISAA